MSKRSKKSALSFETICASEVAELRKNPAHILPIYASSAFVFDNMEQSVDVFTKKIDGHLYSRYANPTVDSVAAKIAHLESFDSAVEAACLLTNSGMSAISLLFGAMLKSGDTVLTQGNLYGGTTELLNVVFSRLGIKTLYTDLGDLDTVRSLLAQDKTIRLVYGETPANPSLQCLDLLGLADVCRMHQVYSAIDNTFCTPYLQRPLNFGIDFVVHSTTKSLNGHGNCIGGALVFDKTHLPQVWQSYKLLGLNPSPFDTWLLHNGMKTLTLRVDKACANALAIAKYLDSHPSVELVNYPGLVNHPSHDIASKQMAQFGSMLSFEVRGGVEAGKRFMDAVNLLTLAPTLGDLDTLLLHPASSSHLNIDRAVRLTNGITDGLIRMSVGVELLDDLLADIRQALDSLQNI